MRLELARHHIAELEAQQVCGFTADDYAQVLADLLPRGWAWPRDPRSTLMHVMRGLAGEFARIHARDCDLLAESYPGTATETLTDWERICGLPDPCTGPLETLQERRWAILAKLASRGGQSRQYYIDIAAAVGFHITIQEFEPFRVGRNVTGQAIYGLEWIFVWRVNWYDQERIFAFRTGQSATREPLRRWGNDLLECLIRGVAPAHTLVQFAFQLNRSDWDRDDPAGLSVWDDGESTWDPRTGTP
jgi:uncharacterized protein YmfQ (DUF2313 family)